MMGAQADLGLSNWYHSMQCVEHTNVQAIPKKVKKEKKDGSFKPLSFMEAAGTCCGI